MGMISGGQLAVDALREKGVTKVFSLCGGHINPLYECCGRLTSGDLYHPA